MPTTEIRSATADDAARICAIYNVYIATTTISFEEEAVTETAMVQRIADVQQAGLPWLVLVVDGELRGYAYATKWRVRSAYRFSVESSVYLDASVHGQGWGTLLYRRLLEALRACGRHMVIAGIAQPNEKSVALHERLGFRKVAHFSQVGLKFGRWVDVGYWEMALGDRITIVDGHPADHAAAGMIDALSSRLAAITGDDGRSHFKPEAADVPRSCFLLAMRGEEVVGCGALRPLSDADADEVGEIKRMYAHLPGLGIGSRLLAALEERARGFGFKALRLETRKVNEAAVQFYLRHGYAVCENYGPYVGRAEAVCFEKRLAPTR